MDKKKPRDEAAALLARLAREGMERLSPMSGWERELESEARERGQAEMDRKLAALAIEDGRAKACPRCGKPTRVRRRAVERTFQSLWGTHTIRRDYHYCESCKEGFFPRDEFLGLPKEGVLTEEVESRIADFAVNDVYEEAEARWRFHYRLLPVSDNQFRQVARRLGEQVEACNGIVLEGAVRPPPSTPAKRLYAMADGGMIPMRQGWREVKAGVCFREENHSPSSAGSRGIISEARYTAVLGNQEEFKAQMKCALQAENVGPQTEVIWLCDGAPENWLLASLLCPSATQILDWCHAVQAGVRCGKVLLGEGDPGLPDWQERVEGLLARGAIDQLLNELRACLLLAAPREETKAVEDLLRYYGNNCKRMAYADFRGRGFLIGSGTVESAHRHVIQTRMKKAGQHWSERGGRQMARMRAVYRTAGPDRFYAAIRWAYRTTRRATRALPKPHKLDMRRRGLAQR